MKQSIAGSVRFVRIIALLILITIACVVGFFIFSSDPDDMTIGPYQNFVVNDVSKPQTFIIPAQIIPPVVVRYRIERMVDDSASVSFRTSTYRYDYVNFKGVIADSSILDFYEMSDMQISYEPKRARKGHLVIKATLNW